MATPHEKFVGSCGCCICGQDAQVHHLLRVKGRHMMGRRADDMFAIPLCLGHHADLHDDGEEETFLATYKVNGEWLAGVLWGAEQATRFSIPELIEQARYGKK